MKKAILPLFIALFALASCQNAGTESESTSGENCTYSFNNEATQLKWTAFKFTDKVAVGGTFKNIYVRNTKTADTPLDVIRELKFSIPINGIDTQNEDRDSKIQNFFFGTLANTEALTGEVRSIEGDDISGKATITVYMNDMAQDVEMMYVFVDDQFTLNGKIDVKTWNAQSGIDSLNTICYDLHTGTDGVSMLWSEVDLEIVAKVNIKCE
jgi:hypothetical protein